MGQIGVLSANEHSQGTKGNTDFWLQPRSSSTHWPHSFFIHHWISL